MDNIYIKSIQAVQKVMINDKHCFELYPYVVTFTDAICKDAEFCFNLELDNNNVFSLLFM